jgi:hypothetical protein
MINDKQNNKRGKSDNMKPVSPSFEPDRALVSLAGIGSSMEILSSSFRGYLINGSLEIVV